MKRVILSLFFVLVSLYLFAQDSAAVQSEAAPGGLRANEKIYVVLAVLITILAGLFIYVIRLDRKISRLEKTA